MESLLQHIKDKQPELTHRGSINGLYSFLKTYPKELKTTKVGYLALIHRSWLLWIAVWSRHELLNKWNFSESDTSNLAKLIMNLVKPKPLMVYSPLIWDLENAGNLLENAVKSEEFAWSNMIDLQDCNDLLITDIISMFDSLNQGEMMLLFCNMVSNYSLLRELRIVMMKSQGLVE